MTRRYSKDDYGFWSSNYYDEFGVRTLPDWDASLYWEFWDSGNTLRYTATTISAPALESDNDSEGPFVKLENLPLADFDLGLVTVKAYAKKGGVEIQPYPYISIAFEVYQSDFVGAYGTPEQVIEYTGVEPDDLDVSTETQLKQILFDWLLQFKGIIDDYCGQEWEVNPLNAPEGVVQASYRMAANMVNWSKQRRKGLVIKFDNFNIKIIEESIFTEEIKKLLIDGHHVLNPVAITTGTNPTIAFATLVAWEDSIINPDNQEDYD